MIGIFNYSFAKLIDHLKNLKFKKPKIILMTSNKKVFSQNKLLIIFICTFNKKKLYLILILTNPFFDYSLQMMRNFMVSLNIFLLD